MGVTVLPPRRRERRSLRGPPFSPSSGPRPRVHLRAAGSAFTADPSPGTSADWLDALADPWCTTAGQLGFYRQIAALSPEHTRPLVDRLGEVRCPVRIGWGEDDPWIPVDQSDRLAEALPGTPEVTRFPTIGHLVPLEAPDLLADATAAWLNA